MEFQTFFPLTVKLNKAAIDSFGDNDYWTKRADRTFAQSDRMRTLGAFTSALIGCLTALAMVAATIGVIALFCLAAGGPFPLVPLLMNLFIGAVVAGVIGSLAGFAISSSGKSGQGVLPANVMGTLRLLLTSPVLLPTLALDALLWLPRGIINLCTRGEWKSGTKAFSSAPADMTTTFTRRTAAPNTSTGHQSEHPLTETTYASPLSTESRGENDVDQLSVRSDDSDVSVASQRLTNT
ncbi:MAG: hypothetical protein DHS20C10_03570 [marine bacterium B5-7]|nr:MAG: hypothetical protein DHS20C10_03570 [marine bacterium B5-7]